MQTPVAKYGKNEAVTKVHVFVTHSEITAFQFFKELIPLAYKQSIL